MRGIDSHGPCASHAVLPVHQRPAGPRVGRDRCYPYRAFGLPLDPDVAFAFGLAISLAANAVTVFSTFLLGYWTSGRREVGLIASTLFALWPIIALFVGRSREFGPWNVDLGLSLYSEPVSTALVTTGCALLVRSTVMPKGTAVAAGALLGFSVAVRLSNALIAGVAVVFAALAGSLRTSLWVAAAGLAFLPLVLAYWPKGYEALPESAFRNDAFGIEYALPAWRDSAVWGWTALFALVPLAVLGILHHLPPAGVALVGVDPLHRRLLHVLLLHPAAPTVPPCRPAGGVRALGAGAMALRNRALYGSLMCPP